LRGVLIFKNEPISLIHSTHLSEISDKGIFIIEVSIDLLDLEKIKVRTGIYFILVEESYQDE
jgi:hypothetical protein